MPRHLSLLVLVLASCLPGPSLAADKTTTYNGTTVQILGQSGKFTITSANATTGLQVTMDALREVDTAGNAVGTSGNPKHSINTFANQAFTFGTETTGTIGNATAGIVQFSSPISTIGQIVVDNYFIYSAGVVNTSTESFPVYPGDLKWSITLSNWVWCGCQQGQTTQTGDGVEVDITLKGSSTASNTFSSTNVYDMGEGITVALSNLVNVDGNWTTMKAGYPKLVGNGNHHPLPPPSLPPPSPSPSIPTP